MKLLRLKPAFIALTFFILVQHGSADGPSFDGHLKYELLGQDHGDGSLTRKVAGASSTDQIINFRFNVNGQQNNWDWRIDYQLSGQFGDSIQDTEKTAQFTGANITSTEQSVQNDDQRLVDLSYLSRAHPRSIVNQRLDRFYIGYTGDKTVIRLGRQAVSWGNGLFYSPMDVFNPFDPTAIDKEYKTGDDMLYGQYLRENGDDLQTVYVARRNPLTEKLESDSHSFALKYHGFIAANEFDLLLAKHFDDTILGIGGVKSIGGAVWRGDITITDTEDDVINSLVTNISYSWMWGKKNASGMIEYFHNGFGQKKEQYTPYELYQNIPLIKRLERGENFTVGKNYLAASITTEFSALWLVTSSVFGNLDDHSALLQFTSRHDLLQDLQLIIAVNIPTGSKKTEFGGIDSLIMNKDKMLNLKPSRSVFLQVAWYF